ncbi:archease [Pseudothermotoga thermarum]|uniref:Archease domain-containing protein n=1 Tax=Pseudothermotoga thermarum DSM 5069 TaxID=688269 RepID=F7YV03_9THEM|nr:archease [Pseudothermotoga thermarum]AEH50287.1 protein of unknown function DUF101 [Pseudothermotoga thermarum DSM 5069]
MYRELDHTADVRYEIVCDSLKCIFSDLIEIFKDHYSPVFLDECTVVEYDINKSIEDLVFDVVNDWIYMIDAKKLFPKECEVQQKLLVRFCKVQKIHGTEFKALTYHGLQIVEEKNILKLKVVFDT